MAMVEHYHKTPAELKSLKYMKGTEYSDQQGIMKMDGKKSRREIANSNERKRMLSINTGFQQLKAVLPLSEDDKVSKSAVLQQAVAYIKKLEIARRQNSFLVRRVTELKKSMCGKTCACEGKCCALGQVPGGAIEEQAMECETVTESIALRQNFADVARRLAESQTQLAAERKRVEVMQNFISRILCQSSAVSSDSDIPSSQDESTDKLRLDLKKDVLSALPDELKASVSGSDLISSTSRSNLDTIVEAIRHLEGGESSASIVKRFRLSNPATDGSLKLVYGGAEGGFNEGEYIFEVDPNQLMYAVDEPFIVRQEEVGQAPAVAAFELVCDASSMEPGEIRLAPGTTENLLFIPSSTAVDMLQSRMKT